MIDSSKTVTAIRLNGTILPLATAGVTVTSSTNTGYVIVVADIGNTVITVKNSNSEVVGTYTTPVGGGSKTISVSATGVYTVTAVRNGETVWTSTVTINGIGAVCAKVPMNIYTGEDIHNICQAGIFSIMFDLKDEWTFTQSGSIFNNQVFIVEKIETILGKNIAQFRKKTPYATTYIWDNMFGYMASASATSFTGTSSSAGGYKYSTLRSTTMMKQGDTVYIQATGIKSDTSSISTGIKFSEIYYTNGNGTKSGVYTYDPSSDTFTQDEEMTYFASSSVAQTDCKFLKGYFVSVGSGIGQETFDAGHYYTRSGSAGSGTGYIYTPATSYSASTTYYGFYETIQSDGVFVNALSSIKQYLVSFNDYSSTGLTNQTYTSLTQDLVDINCVEEFTGVNRTTDLKGNVKATTIGAYNIQGEGGRYSVYENIYDIYCGVTEWTRSTYSSNSSNACYLNNGGNLNNYIVYNGYACRPGFRIA